jgi:hypothetical protein
VDRSSKPRSPSIERKLDVPSASHTLGSYLSAYRINVLGLTQEKMSERISRRVNQAGRERGMSASTYRKMESGDPTVNFTYWLAAFQEFGVLNEVIKASEPAIQAFHSQVAAIPGYEDHLIESEGTYGR